jgi:hypothetical protein
MFERQESVLDDNLFYYFPVSVWEGICPKDILVLKKMGLNEVFLDVLLLIGFPWIDVIIVKIIGFIGEPCQHGTLNNTPLNHASDYQEIVETWIV